MLLINLDISFILILSPFFIFFRHVFSFFCLILIFLFSFISFTYNFPSHLQFSLYLLSFFVYILLFIFLSCSSSNPIFLFIVFFFKRFSSSFPYIKDSFHFFLSCIHLSETVITVSSPDQFSPMELSGIELSSSVEKLNGLLMVTNHFLFENALLVSLADISESTKGANPLCSTLFH
ncbi:unnamed protein product [Acanthosepion pharaonis]|uniref:Uncharacterized protein n=1 Tax=Acanthosepion pharaonis TaxID=158019 RepID=A0A812BIT4_ACAPH|nr:unnamed protein product [Sepia pharaonis]